MRKMTNLMLGFAVIMLVFVFFMDILKVRMNSI